MLGRNCRFLQGPETDPEAVRRLREARSTDQTVSVTVLNYRHDGSTFYNHLVVSPVFDAAGVLTHRVSVQTDVTARMDVARERDEALSLASRAERAQAEAEDVGRFGGSC